MDEKNQDSIAYEFKAKIMISSVVILFVACFIIVLFHVYKRWFCRRRRRSHHHSDTTSAVIIAAGQGLDIKAVNSLPTFVYESKNHEYPPECAVCLSEFEDNEAGRILPECNHCFHTDCIGMWLLSHCDCPLCRTRVTVQPDRNPERGMGHVVVNVSGNMNSGPGSDLNPDESDMGCCSSSHSRSPETTIPRGQDPGKTDGAPDPNRNIGPGNEAGSNTPAGAIWVLF